MNPFTDIVYEVEWTRARDRVKCVALFDGMKIGQMQMTHIVDDDLKPALDFRSMRIGFDAARDLPLYAVTSSELDPEYQGKGIGYRMYREAFKFLAKNGGAWVCPDGHRKDGQTSKDAMKVWKSLSESFDGNDYFLIVRPNTPVAAAMLDEAARRVEAQQLSPQEVGRRVKAWCKSDASYKLMDRYHSGLTWTAGWCLILARALAPLLSDGRVVALCSLDADYQDVGQHAGVLYQNYIIDADGARSPEDWAEFWELNEDVEAPYILGEYKITWGKDILKDKRAVNAASKALKQVLSL